MTLLDPEGLAWETLRVDRPEIHYARSGNVYLGYQVFGNGPFDLVVVPGFLPSAVARMERVITGGADHD